jgi:ferredoxin
MTDYRMPKIRVKVDEDLCIGAASCVTIAPETFQLNVENKAFVYDHSREPGGSTYERWLEVTEEEKENILLAAQSCPTLAIFIFDEIGVQLFPEM